MCFKYFLVYLYCKVENVFPSDYKYPKDKSMAKKLRLVECCEKQTIERIEICLQSYLRDILVGNRILVSCASSFLIATGLSHLPRDILLHRPNSSYFGLGVL